MKSKSKHTPVNEFYRKLSWAFKSTDGINAIQAIALVEMFKYELIELVHKSGGRKHKNKTGGDDNES